MSVNISIYDISQKNENELQNVFASHWAVKIAENISKKILDKNKCDMSIFSAIMRRKILSEYLSILPENLEFFNGKYGKPELLNCKDIHFNVSHSNSIWVIAICNSGSIGVDVEFIRKRKYMSRIMNNYFHDEENEHYKSLETYEKQEDYFYELWTKKESYAKYLGKGLSYNFSSESFLKKTPDGIYFFSKKISEGSAILTLTSCEKFKDF